ncbi:hypothetical protein SNEBB_002631 [Seison nebaliae]|nr:hypothetical protein SNEBB_002631 [Seison nebaliae]
MMPDDAFISDVLTDKGNVIKKFKDFWRVPIYQSILYFSILLITLPFFIICRLCTIFDRREPSWKYLYGDENVEYLKKKNFRLMSINVCLLPEWLDRFNHLFNSQERAGKIGRI